MTDVINIKDAPKSEKEELECIERYVCVCGSQSYYIQRDKKGLFLECPGCGIQAAATDLETL